MNWIVAHTQVSAETKATFQLRRQGFEVYLPQFRKTWRHARRIEQVVRPLFPRYLFIAGDAETLAWRAINSTFGVQNLVMQGDRPAVAPQQLVDDIRAREDDSGLIAIADKDAFGVGDRVRVVNGPLTDHLGIFECAHDDHRVMILLDFLGRKVRTKLRVEDLQLAG